MILHRAEPAVEAHILLNFLQSSVRLGTAAVLYQGEPPPRDILSNFRNAAEREDPGWPLPQTYSTHYPA